MRSPWFAFSLCGALTSALAGTPPTGHDQTPAMTTDRAVAPGTAAMRVWRDLQTGKLYPAPPEAGAPPRWDNSKIKIYQYPNGMLRADFNGQRDAVLTVHRAGDGTLEYHCTGDAGVPGGLSPSPAVVSPARDGSHVR